MNEQEIYDFFGEKNYWLFDEKKAKIKGNLYDKYFEGTCSLINYKSELIIDIIGKNNSQSRNYENKNELNANIVNDNKNLQKCFIKKLNYKIKRK